MDSDLWFRQPAFAGVECTDEMGTQQPNIHGKIHDVYTWNVFCWGTGYVNRTQNLYGISIIIIENNFAGIHLSFRGPTYVVSTFCVREVSTCRRTVRALYVLYSEYSVRALYCTPYIPTRMVRVGLYCTPYIPTRMVRVGFCDQKEPRKLMCTPAKLFSMMIMEIENNFAGVHMIFRVL